MRRRDVDVNNRSLSVGVGDDGKTLLNCKARGCPPEAIVSAVHMTMADLFPTTNRHSNSHRARIVTEDDARRDLRLSRRARRAALPGREIHAQRFHLSCVNP
jgi:hypothetical protein